MTVFSPPQSVRSVEVQLGKHPTSVRLARKLAREWFYHWGTKAEIVEDSQLVVSELVTNAITRAKGQSVRLRLRFSGVSAYIEVWDADPSPPQVQTDDPLALGGRGLVLVKEYAERWGHYHAEGGKVVWAELR